MIRRAVVLMAVLSGALVAVLEAGRPGARFVPPGASAPATQSRPVRPRVPVSTRPATVTRFPAASQPASNPAEGETEAMYRACLEWFDRAIPYVDRMVPAAEVVADRFIGGGMLYAAGNGGFGDELETRAGGFPFTKVFDGQRVEDWDVVLLGKFRPIETELLYSRFDGLLSGGRNFDGAVVCFASRNWPLVERAIGSVPTGRWGDRFHFIDTGAPDGGSMTDLCVGQLATVALAWAFQGEVIAAATRQGKTLASYASDWEPGGPDWDATVRDHHLHPKYRVPPIPAGQIGKQYLRTCRGLLEKFLSTGQPDKVRQAGRRLADCMAGGGVVWILADGHVHPRGAYLPADMTRMRMMGRSYAYRPDERMAEGDMLLYLGYLRYPRWAVDRALARKCDAVVLCVDDAPSDRRIAHIGSCFTDWDTVIDLPDYPIRVLPASGTVQTPQWYALLAETLKAASAK